MPRVGVDYWFITAEGLKKRSELDYETNPKGEAALLEGRQKGIITKCLILRCHESKCVFLPSS